jgi:ribonuclease HI
MYCDGACRGNPGLAGVGVAIMDEEGKVMLSGLSHFVGLLTNNQSEYMAVIHGLLWFRSQGHECDGLDIYCDSRLVVMQILQQHKVRNDKLAPLYRVVRRILSEIPNWTITHIPREENKIADALAAASLQPYLK